MKLPIKHEFFEQIKNGSKTLEHRDAHITFIDEKTKEEHRVNIFECYMTKKSRLPRRVRHLFDDRNIIAFVLDN